MGLFIRGLKGTTGATVNGILIRGADANTVAGTTATIDPVSGAITLQVTGAFVDNVGRILNTSATGSSKGYSAFSFYSPADAALDGRALAAGFGPDVAGGNEYANRAYFATNNAAASGAATPPEMIFSQEKVDGTPGNQHARVLVSYAALNTYGWSTSAVFGPLATSVATDGRIGIGTATLTTGAQMTVLGAIGGTSAAGTGTLSGSGFSYTLTGSGTAFITEVHVGDRIFSSNNEAAIVRSIESDTSLTTVTTQGWTAGAYTIYRPHLSTPNALNNGGGSVFGTFYIGGTAQKLILDYPGQKAFALWAASDGNWLFQNLTNNSNPMSISGSAPDSSLAIGSGGDATFGFTVKAAGYKSSDGSAGATGSADATNTLTIKNGLITNIA